MTTPENRKSKAFYKYRNACFSKRRKKFDFDESIVISESPSEYPGWNYYFPNISSAESPQLLQIIRACQNCFIPLLPEVNFDKIIDDKCILVSYAEFSNCLELQDICGNFFEYFSNNAIEFVLCASLAFQQCLFEIGDFIMKKSFSCYLFVRIVGFMPFTSLRSLKSNFNGKTVSITGTAVRVGSVYPKCIQLTYLCNKCKKQTKIIVTNGHFQDIGNCFHCKALHPVLSREECFLINWQMIRLQEKSDQEEAELQAGSIMRTIDIHLTRDMVSTCVPGDYVTVVGVVEVDGNKSSDCLVERNLFSIVVNALSICVKSDGSHSDPDGKEGSSVLATQSISSENCSLNNTLGNDFFFTNYDVTLFESIRREPELFNKLIKSFAPSIFGNEKVKLGLLLSLFGGCETVANDQKTVLVRGNVHVLVVGDPGVGKSQMLLFACDVSQRGCYISGVNSTASGLSITLHKDNNGGHTMEAGALVLSDRGCCCIDEFDKMTLSHSALLEAMEQQHISIAKAGVVSCLPTRTTILAAANPNGGHYQTSKSFQSNIKISPALLSRFDIIFMMLDVSNENLDAQLSKHKLLQYSSNRHHEHEETEWRSNSNLIPKKALRKFISFVRFNFKPTLSEEAAEVLQKFYLQLRMHSKSDCLSPITTRLLQSLIRLSEARAKMECRDVVTVHDAEDIIALMKSSVVDTYSNVSGFGAMFDSTVSGKIKRKKGRSAQTKQFVSELIRISKSTSNDLFTIEQMQNLINEKNLSDIDLSTTIYSLNEQGFLLKKKENLYQLISSSI